MTDPVNFGSGYPATLKSIIYRIAEKLNANDLIQLGALPSAANDGPLVTANIKRLSEEVVWQPSHDLNHSLDETIDWWKFQINTEKN